MKIAHFWARQTADARGREGRVEAIARGWSDESMDAAVENARRRAQQIAQLLAGGRSKLAQYAYGDLPLPEPILQEFSDAAGPYALVTRNAYGATILKARDLMFVDIDELPNKPLGNQPIMAVIGGLLYNFSRKPAPLQAPAPDAKIDDIRRVADANGLSGRLYKTAGGYRFIVGNRTFKAADPSTTALLQDFGSDPLYVRLCKNQECFRARLTPKPYRMRMKTAPGSYPFTPKQQARMDAWLRRYEENLPNYATCRFLTEVGGAPQLAAFDELLRFHDERTQSLSNLPLA